MYVYSLVDSSTEVYQATIVPMPERHPNASLGSPFSYVQSDLSLLFKLMAHAPSLLLIRFFSLLVVIPIVIHAGSRISAQLL